MTATILASVASTLLLTGNNSGWWFLFAALVSLAGDCHAARKCGQSAHVID